MGIDHSITILLLSSASSVSACLWCVSIDNGPAPSPQDGPPFSAHASRNRALLPYQIVGVVAAYVGSVVLITSLLLTFGRRMRKRSQTQSPQSVEMVKAINANSPVSPVESNRAWYSPRRGQTKKSAASSIRSASTNHRSPGMESVLSFDNEVIEADRKKRQEEMERLYAAVMAQDEQRSRPVSAGPATELPPQYSRTKPPRLITNDPGLRHLRIPEQGPSSPRSPTTPKSPVRAIYPPDSNIPANPTSPTSPLRAEIPENYLPGQQGSQPRNRTLSVGSVKTVGSSSSRKFRKSLKHIKISAPLQKPDDDNSDGARTPLSPRFYTDPGTPPEPPTARTTETRGTAESDADDAITPGTARSWPYDEEEQYHAQIDEVRAVPLPNPQRASAYNYSNPAQNITNAASTRPDPTKPSGASASATASSGSLPLREMNRQYQMQTRQAQQVGTPQQTAAFPLSPGTWNAPKSAGGRTMTSAGPVKTTFLEARRDKFSAPRTGLATPYSPYMPFTPLTPVTPRLTTRAERKQREREERTLRGAITEEDQVADDAELWSSGY